LADLSRGSKSLNSDTGGGLWRIAPLLSYSPVENSAKQIVNTAYIGLFS